MHVPRLLLRLLRLLRRLPLVGTPIVLLATAACGGGGDSIAPRQFSGTYIAQSANGNPLPALVCTSFITDSTIITAGSIEFVAPDSLRTIEWWRLAPDPVAYPAVRTRRYAVRRQAVLLFAERPPGAPTLLTDSLIIDGEVLRHSVICSGAGTPPVTLEYRK